MSVQIRFRGIQAGLILFWSVWLTLVGATNLLDGLKRLGLLPESWTLTSGNYQLVAGSVGVHGVPATIAALLFAGVVVWQLIAAGMFWRAFRAFRRNTARLPDEVVHAFAVTLALWAGFLFATEATIAYLTAHSHMGVFIALLASLLVVRSGESTREAAPVSDATGAVRAPAAGLPPVA